MCTCLLQLVPVATLSCALGYFDFVHLATFSCALGFLWLSSLGHNIFCTCCMQKIPFLAARQVRFLEALIEPGLVKGSGRIWAWVTWQLPAPEKRQVAKCCKRIRHLASLGLLALGYFQAWKVSRKSGPSWVCCCDRSLEPLNRALSRGQKTDKQIAK